MVSFQALPSPNGRKTSIPELDDSSKKRKWEEPLTEGILEKRLKPESTKSFFEIELHLETPLPLEWQRCLDIQSGQIYFYNTRTHKRTSRDPRRSPEPPSPDHHMSLDLELNLPYDQSRRKNYANDRITKHNSGGSNIPGLGDLFKDSSRDNESSGGLTRRPLLPALTANSCIHQTKALLNYSSKGLASYASDQGEQVPNQVSSLRMLSIQ
ncbi:unnamed protein product [Dovyalis caffra]|uniref:WW domain-containing protein n=1 Tax=Dovyalis caffra TaxID=77055 RepID=A0AAV1S9E5_9ROSI|nr:unnamed protein product [Dovyalis caffra]